MHYSWVWLGFWAAPLPRQGIPIQKGGNALSKNLKRTPKEFQDPVL